MLQRRIKFKLFWNVPNLFSIHKIVNYFSKYFQIKLSLRQTDTNIRLNDINKTPFTLTGVGVGWGGGEGEGKYK